MSRLFRSVVCLSFLLFSCTTPSPKTSDEIFTPEVVQEKIKILSYNVLHGLKVGTFWVSQGESPQHKQKRFQLQVKQLTQVQPDIVFLQEVNPLPGMAKQYITVLKEHGLQYEQVHQVDACGWRLSENIALIKELNNGLVILAREGNGLQEIEGLKLSGSGGCHDTWGIQFGELRYALVGEITWPGTQEKFLLVNVHLHSGIESDAYFLKELSDSHKQGRLSHYDELKSELLNDQEERLSELRALTDELDALIARNNYAGIVLGGDFNFEQRAPGYKELLEYGAVDLAKIATQKNTHLQTIDPEKDTLAQEDAKTVPGRMRSLIEDESTDDRQEILADYQDNIRRPRKVDYIFVIPIHSHVLPKNGCVEKELFGLEEDASGHPGSDHYGILNTYPLSASQC